MGVLLLSLVAAAAAVQSSAPLDDTGGIVAVRGVPRSGVIPDPHQRAKVGSRCEVHHGQRLRLDLVPLHHGIVTFIPGRNSEDERKRFPNAWPWAGGGCVAGPQKFAEVAYCRRCRVVYQWDNLRERVTRPLHGRQGR